MRKLLTGAALLAGLFGENEVAEVDRVEGAAENADAHGNELSRLTRRIRTRGQYTGTCPPRTASVS